MTIWNRARMRQQQGVRKRHVFAPVGVALSTGDFDRACNHCGMLFCATNCPTLAKPERLGSLRACPTCGWDPLSANYQGQALDCGDPHQKLREEHRAHRDAHKQVGYTVNPMNNCTHEPYNGFNPCPSCRDTHKQNRCPTCEYEQPLQRGS